MLFNSWVFVAFLLLVLPVYYYLSHRWQNRFLLVASYVFYGWWDWRFLSLLAFSTVLDYVVALLLEREASPRKRRLLLGCSILGNLGLLGFFKYFNFFVDTAVLALEQAGWHPNRPLLNVVLPVGISFYTFQTLSYTIDVYRRQQKACHDFIGFALFVTYFPQLVAGPIERASRLLPQILAPRRVGQAQWNSGAQLLLWGYVKKVAVADSLAPFVENAFRAPEEASGLMLWLALYCFALQIYCDFSGYTDIARGVSRLMGIDLMENFKQPYLARNITEFWRRWHISLSTWLRDYLYIPLGGNRRGAIAQYRNLMITMLLGGLWHGADWTFVLWGGLHGVYLAAHKFITRNRRIGIEPPPAGLRDGMKYALNVLVTFHLVCLTWVFFRADNISTAFRYLRQMAVDWDRPLAPLATPEFVGIIDSLVFYGLLVIMLDLASWRRNAELPLSERNRWWIRGLCYAAGFLVLAFVREQTGASFIYFQF